MFNTSVENSMLEFLLQLLHFFFCLAMQRAHKGKAGRKIASMLNSRLASGKRGREREPCALRGFSLGVTLIVRSLKKVVALLWKTIAFACNTPTYTISNAGKLLHNQRIRSASASTLPFCPYGAGGIAPNCQTFPVQKGET